MLALRSIHPDVRLIMAIPHARQTQYWSDDQIARYMNIVAQADSNRVLSQHYYKGCLIVRDHYMVDRACFCLCYLDKMKGGTMSTVAYALTEHLQLLNLAMPDQCAEYLRDHPIV